MRAFHFRLQTLLNLREMAREEALSTYASAIRQRELNEEKLADCNNTLDELNRCLSILTFDSLSSVPRTSINFLSKIVPCLEMVDIRFSGLKFCRVL